jgi:DNA-binding CsgD family transcriptional regulator
LRQRPSAADDLARLAHHAEAAADEEAVLTYAPAAARRAAELGAHREAAAQYARALRYAGGLPAGERESLQASLFLEFHLTGQLGKAIATGEALVALAKETGDQTKEAERLAWLAWVLVAAGRNADAERASRASLDLLASLPPGPTHGFVNFVQATLRMLDRDNAEAIDWGRRAIALAEHFDNLEVRVRALNTVGAARILAGDEAGGQEDMAQSLALARAAGMEADVAAVYSVLGSSLGEIYQFSLAEQVLTEGVAYTAERDLDRWRWYIVAWLALTRLYQGRWTEAAELATAVLRTPMATTISRIMALLALGRVRARRGDPDVAAVLDEALQLAAPTGTLQRLAPVRAARAEAAWLAGDQERTAEEAQAVFDLAERHQHRWHLGELGYWLWRAGKLTTPPTGAAAPFALQIAGDWAGAAAAWRELGCPYEAARALADSPEEGALRGALVVFERLGARPATVAVTRRLHELGARDIPRGPRPATRAHPALLTPREAEVLALLAEGNTNAEIAASFFLSPKTVEHHVSAILAKLGARSRHDAIRAARDLGILAPN